MKRAKRAQWIDHFQDIHELMEENLDRWISIGEIRKTYDDFVRNLQRLNEMRNDLSRDLSPFRNALIEKRRGLLQKLSPVTNVLAVYLQDHPSGKRIHAMVQQRHQTKNIGNAALLKYARRMNKLLKKKMAEQKIARYGLSEGMLMELGTAIHELESARKLKKDLFTSQDKLVARAEKLIRKNRKLLSKRLDQLMTVFSGTHPALYKAYRELRDQI